jgi:hypothetical protein
MTLETLIAMLGSALAAISVLGPVLAGLPAMYARLVQSLLRRNLRRLHSGDAGPRFATYANDMQFVFPGQNSWTADLRGRDEVERWLERFVRVGLQLETHEILVAGPPWNTSVCVRFTVHCAAANGDIVYASRGTIFLRIAWSQVKYCEVHEDTQKVAAFDDYLALLEPAGT